ncbi:MAG: discoidin domain-containing protein [Sphingobacteriaceae bacterium]
MTEVKNLHGFSFWPAPTTAKGNPANILIEVSMDGTNWTNAGEFTLVNTFERQVVYLSKTTEARYFKINVLTSTGLDASTHPSEIGAF